MVKIVVEETTAPLAGLAKDAWNARGNWIPTRGRRGAVPMYANHNKIARQSIPFDVLKAREDV